MMGRPGGCEVVDRYKRNHALLNNFRERLSPNKTAQAVFLTTARQALRLSFASGAGRSLASDCARRTSNSEILGPSSNRPLHELQRLATNAPPNDL